MQDKQPQQAPHQLLAAEGARRIRDGQLTSERLVRSCLDHISRLEPRMQAWAALDAASAIEAARKMDQSPSRGLLHGVPVGIKDVIDTADFPTAFNSPIHRGRRPGRDAAVVARAHEAGMVVLGKTATQEFATRGDAGPTRHPHSMLHSPGGSSSGSAVAVACTMVPLAISTQTAGSIIRPASYCGVVGFKPSFGLLNTDGVRLIAPSFDTVGFHARCVEDVSLALHVLRSAGASGDHLIAPIAQPRIALCRTTMWHKAGPAVREVLTDVAAHLEGNGFEVRALELPTPFGGLEAAHNTISDFESRSALDWEWTLHRKDLSAGVQAKLLQGEAISDVRYQNAKAVVESCRAHLLQMLAPLDAILTPSAPDIAPPFSRTETGDSAFSKAWTALGLPCVSLPVPKLRALPIGVQLVGSPGADGRLLHIAQQIESILFKPPMH